MMGRSSKPYSKNLNENSKCIVFCHSPKRDYYKKFLFEPYPVESHLNHFLADHLTAEIVANTIQNKQDCIDWITWTFMYRRLQQNPNYYNLQEVSGIFINDYLSDLIENTVQELEQSKCIAVEDEDEMELLPLNLGIISSYYYIKYNTINQFMSCLTAQSKMKQIIEILSTASEFEIVI